MEDVRLLGVRVTVHADLDAAEHARRVLAGLGAVTDPALLDRLLDVLALVPVIDPVLWAEMSNQPPGVIQRGKDGLTVTRVLQPPLTIHAVVVPAPGGGELAAVRDASLFAGFATRWMAAARDHVREAAMLEARLCGVGVLDRHGNVLLAAETLAAPLIDGWAWLLREKTYQQWLRHGATAAASW